MAGLSLQTGARVRGTYTPLTPAASSAPSGSGGTIAQQAYGVSGTGLPMNSSVGISSVAAGVVASVLLLALYWSLPR
jgi:hypothetical protein